MNWNEWDPLKEVIVGKVYHPEDMTSIEDVNFRNNLQRILEESEEDFIMLTQILQSYGVKVHRPDCKFTGEFRYPAVCPRDMHVVYGEQTFGRRAHEQGSHGTLEHLLFMHVHPENQILTASMLKTNTFKHVMENSLT